MAMLVTLIGGVGLVAAARCVPAHVARVERLGGVLLVASLVGLGLDLARAAG